MALRRHWRDLPHMDRKVPYEEAGGIARHVLNITPNRNPRIPTCTPRTVIRPSLIPIIPNLNLAFLPSGPSSIQPTSSCPLPSSPTLPAPPSASFPPPLPQCAPSTRPSLPSTATTTPRSHRPPQRPQTNTRRATRVVTSSPTVASAPMLSQNQI